MKKTAEIRKAIMIRVCTYVLIAPILIPLTQNKFNNFILQNVPFV